MKPKFFFPALVAFMVTLTTAAVVKAKTIAEEVIVLKDHEIAYSIGDKVFLYEDKTEQLDIQQVQEVKEEFAKSTQTAPAYGFTTTVVWSYFTVKSETVADWYLEIGNSYQYKVDLYSKNETGEFVHHEVGLHKPFESRPVKVNLFILPLDLRKSEAKTFYMRVESRTVVNFPLRIGTIQTLYETNHVDDIVNGLCFGLVIALSLYNFFVFLSLRDKTYLYYVLYMVAFIVNLSWIRGYIQAWIPVSAGNINHSSHPSAAVFIFLCLFTNSFLLVDKFAPKLQWLSYIFYVLSALSVIFTLAGAHMTGFNLIMLQVFLIIPYVMLLCGYVLSRGYRPARFYLLGFSFLTVGVLVFVLKDHGLLPHNLFTVYSMQIGSAIEALVLSFALADKLNIYKKEKEESQAKTLAQSNEFSKQLIRNQENERRRIAGELHDSIGQSLSIIKNKITLLKNHDPRTEVIDDVNELVSQNIQAVRCMSYRLRPFHLDLLGLKQSLKSIVEQVSQEENIKLDIAIDKIDGLFSKENEIHLFRIVQEYLNILIKKTNVRDAFIRISLNESTLDLSFEDDGSVLQSVLEEKTFAVWGIIKRIKILGGSIVVPDTSGIPKAIKVQIPLPIQVFG